MISAQNCWNCGKNALGEHWQGGPTLLGVCHGFIKHLLGGVDEEQPPKAITPQICDMGCLFWVQREEPFHGKN